jgi:hypothetical protein
MEAGQTRSQSRAWPSARLYVLVLGLAGGAYLAIAGWSYPASPFVEVVPAAYEERGLVALFLVATLFAAITQVPRGILLGASQGRTLLFATGVASVTRLALVLALAGAAGAYAIPAAQIAGAAAGGAMGLRAVGRLVR